MIRISFWIGVVVLTLISGLIWGWPTAMVTLALIVADLYLLVFLALELGRRNIFFTVVDEGQAKGITAFGRSHKCLLAYTSHRFQGELDYDAYWRTDEYWNIVRLTQQNIRPEAKNFWQNIIRQILWIELGGLKWVGIWPFYQIYKYEFKWTSLRGQLPQTFDESGVKREQSRIKTIDYILVRQETYQLELAGIEDKDLIPIDIKIVWTVRIINPFKAMFRVQEWLETSSDRLMAYVRREFAVTTWREFQSIGRNSDSLKQLLQSILDELKKLYGVETIGIEIIELTPPPQFAQAAERVRNAQAGADAAIKEAETIRTLAQAEADRIKTVFGAIKNQGDDGVAMKIVEDLAKGGKTVFAVGAATELVKDILGRKEK